MEGTTRSAPGWSSAAAAAVTVQTTLPVALLGVVYPAASIALAFDPTQLGLMVSAYWLASAAISLTSSRLFVRLSPILMMGLAVLIGVVSAVGAAVWTPSWAALALWAAVGGAANAVGHPASNSLLLSSWGGRPPALTFGLKQAAVPAASLIGGALLPLLVERFGWQSAFWVGAAIGVVVTAMLFVLSRRVKAPPHPARVSVARVTPSVRRRLLLVSLLTLLAATASNSMTAFVVAGALERGIDATPAGVLLVIASLAAVIVRLAAGYLADKGWGGTFRTVALLLAIGSVGLTLMSFSNSALYVAGCVLAFIGAFGWPGLVHYVVAIRFASTPVQGTMLTQSGSYLGSALGPTLFGLTFTFGGPNAGWIAMAGVVGVAGIVAFLADRLARE